MQNCSVVVDLLLVLTTVCTVMLLSPNLRALPKDHKVNLRGYQMINGIEKKKSSATQMCLHSGFFSNLYFLCVIEMEQSEKRHLPVDNNHRFC